MFKSDQLSRWLLTQMVLIGNLEDQLSQVIHELVEREVFKPTETDERNLVLFEKGLKAYSNIHELNIHLTHRTEKLFKKYLHAEYEDQTRLTSNEETVSGIEQYQSKELEELNRVTENYDRLAASRKAIEIRSGMIKEKIAAREFTSCEQLIIGGGNAGTYLWLQAYGNSHQTTDEQLQKGLVPDTLMLAADMGNWKHDYVLAQPHNLIEREDVHSDPKDFTTKRRYENNAYVNSRHLFQSNMINLNETEAPLALGIVIQHIEKKENHSDWKDPNCQYRIKVKIDHETEIYTNKIDLCTGLGQSRDILDSQIIEPELLAQLSVPDSKTDLPPLVDGNAFLLSPSKEKVRGKKIVIYGGGGTATACYRKAFYGTGAVRDTDNYRKEDEANDVFWFFQTTLDPSGTGKKASEAIQSANDAAKLFRGTLRQIVYDNDSKKIKLQFALSNQWVEIECDQFVVCTGQDPTTIKGICDEIESDLTVNPAGLASGNGDIRAFGAAAVALGGKKFQSVTREWILQNQFSRDGEWPGVIPIVHAQINMITSRMGVPLNRVNINTDDIQLIQTFLEEANAPREAIRLFNEELLKHRKTHHSGIKKKELEVILKNHSLHNFVEIAGHGYLKRKNYL